MKRSEMIEIIRTQCAAFGAVTPDLLAKKILEKIEQEGMLPPFYESLFDRSLGESRIYVKNYKWKPENE